MKIRLKNREQIEIMREGGVILKEALELAMSLATPGRKTIEIDKEVEKFIRSNGAIPGFKGYNNFPATICSSINHEVVHGIPSNYELKDGDIFSIDCGVLYKDYYTDAARSVGIGEISDQAKRLIKVTKDSLYLAIDKIKDGINLKLIAKTIEDFVKKNKFFVVEELVGHGIGKELHEDPQIPNFVPTYSLPNLRNGMTFCIEPMINTGTEKVILESDGQTIITADKSLSAHYEHTLALFNNEVIIIA